MPPNTQATVDELFLGYTEVGEGMLLELKAHTPRPERHG